MTKIFEVIDSLNDESAAEIKQQLKAEADALSKENRQLYARAKKAEGFEFNKEKKQWVKKAESKPEPKKTDDLDYGQKAFIASVLGVKGEKELAKVKEYLDNGKKLEDLAENKHFQDDLKDIREEQAVKDATPAGTKRSGNMAKDSVEYWLAKGELPPVDQRELRQKVVNAKYAREKNVSPF